jgi:hypothetical protein
VTARRLITAAAGAATFALCALALRAGPLTLARLALSGIALLPLVEGLVLVAALLALSPARPEALEMGDVKLALLLVRQTERRGAQ